MANVLKLMAELGLSATGFHSELKNADRAAQSASRSIQGALAGIVSGGTLAAIAALAAGIAGTAFVLYKAAQAAGEDEASILRLGAAVKAQGQDWVIARGEMDAFLRSERERVALDEGEGRESLIQLISLTGDYTSAMKLLPIAEDWAAGAGMDLVSASELVGRVSQGNTGILQRQGIAIDENTSSTEALMLMQERYVGQAEAFASGLLGSGKNIRLVFDEIKEGVGYALLPALTELNKAAGKLLAPLESAMATLGPLIGDELLKIVKLVLPAGENVSASFAEGLAKGIPYILAVFMTIRGIIETLLKPGSPPKLLPTLDEWGKGAAQSWLAGWTTADFDVLREMSGVIQGALSGLVAEGALEEGAVNPLLRKIRAQIAAALEELRATGRVSAGTMGGFTGPTAAYSQAYLRSRQADVEVTELEAKLAKATTAEEVSALAEQLDAARGRAKEAKSQAQIEQERLEMLADESDLLREQVDTTRELTKALKEAAEGTKKAFDPSQFKLPGGKGVFEFEFNSQEILDEATRLSDGWLKTIEPMLGPLQELVGGTVEFVSTGVAGKKQRVMHGVLLFQVKEGLETMGGVIRTLVEGPLIAFAGGDWRKAMREAGFTDFQIDSVGLFTGASLMLVEALGRLLKNLVIVGEAIDAVHKKWDEFWGEYKSYNPNENLPPDWTGPGHGGVPPGGAAAGFDGVITGPMYIPAFGIVGEQGSERLTVTPLGKGGPGGGSFTQNNYFYVNGLSEQIFAQARRNEQLKELWGRAG